MATTTQRGLGWQHQKQRARLLKHFHDGDICDHCGKPMYKTQPLQADHSVPRSLGGKKADRLLHAWCNESRGNGTRQPADIGTWKPGITSRNWLPDEMAPHGQTNHMPPHPPIKSAEF